MNKSITTPLVILYVIVSLASIIYTLQNIIKPNQQMQQIIPTASASTPIISEETGELYYFSETSSRRGNASYCATTPAMMYCKSTEGHIIQVKEYWVANGQ